MSIQIALKLSANWSRKMRTRVPYPGHQKVAAVTHFTGAYRGPGREAGNIVIALTDGGWFWMIPFKTGATSVGAVCDIARWRESAGGPEALFKEARAMFEDSPLPG